MKTIEQAKKEYADSIVPLGGHDKYSAPFITAFERHENVDDAFKAGVEFAQRWIPVEEELPEANNEAVLAKHRTGTVRLIRIDDYLTQVIIKHNYTHWRKIELT